MLQARSIGLMCHLELRFILGFIISFPYLLFFYFLPPIFSVGRRHLQASLESHHSDPLRHKAKLYFKGLKLLKHKVGQFIQLSRKIEVGLCDVLVFMLRYNKILLFSIYYMTNDFLYFRVTESVHGRQHVNVPELSVQN